MDNKGYIYIITCITNGKFYVGQTRKYRFNGKNLGINGRWNQHIYNSINNREDCPKLNNAIRKYGKDDFIVGKLISCSLDELNFYEKRYVKKFNSIKNGYNCTEGGDYFNCNNEQRNEINKKISKKAKQRWCTEEYREKISQKKINNIFLGKPSEKRNYPNLPANIYVVKKNGILTGYTIRININSSGIKISKTFSSTVFTPDENLKKANKCLQEILKSLEVKIF
jgi:group I intron endonuclease